MASEVFLARRSRAQYAFGKQGWGGHARKAGNRGTRFLTRRVVALVCLIAAFSVRGQEKGSSEYQVKAAFLFHFAQFVDWPNETFTNETSPLTYCTLGEDPFRGELEASLSGKKIGARPIRVQHLRQTQEIPECQILFIGGMERKRMSTLLAALKGAPVLTVGDADHFVNEGGVIGFCLEEKKIRFEINLNAATEARLKISARLLSLAKTVVGDPRAN
jgi:YfiR/HmsC-like